MNSYYTAKHDSVVYVKVDGLANMKNTPVLLDFVNESVEKGTTDLFIDLAKCAGMDSTFMGTLVGFQDQFSKLGRFSLLNPNQASKKLLNLLGVSSVVPIVENEELSKNELLLEPLSGNLDQTKTTRIRAIKDAHKNLVSLNEENKQKFSAFLKALEKDLEGK